MAAFELGVPEIRLLYMGLFSVSVFTARRVQDPSPAQRKHTPFDL